MLPGSCDRYADSGCVSYKANGLLARTHDLEAEENDWVKLGDREPDELLLVREATTVLTPILLSVRQVDSVEEVLYYLGPVVPC